MNTLESIVSEIISMIQGNPMFLKVVGWLAFIWLALTAIKLVAGFIVKLTKSTNDDLVFNKIVSFVDKWIAPIIKLLPHSTLPVNAFVSIASKIFNFIIDLFSKKEK